MRLVAFPRWISSCPAWWETNQHPIRSHCRPKRHPVLKWRKSGDPSPADSEYNLSLPLPTGLTCWRTLPCVQQGNYPLRRSYSELYCASVKLNWKVAIGAFSCALTLFMTGCSGINASQSVSPATFLLPGIMRVEPPPTQPTGPLPETAPAVIVAQVR